MTDLAEQERRGLLLGFGVFGVFWGVSSAVLPAVERNAHVRDRTLGLTPGALAVSAVPAMPLAGLARQSGADVLVILFAVMALTGVTLGA
jgi:hypothetical protein